MIEIVGWLQPEIGASMRELIREVKPEVVVEIGVYAGKSLINAASAMFYNGCGTIYGIDPWRNREALRTLSESDDQELWIRTDLDMVHNACMHAVWECELENVVLIRATSWEARGLFVDESIDILYIDGGHSEEASTLDVTTYLPKVKRGGYVWADDSNYPSLRKALSILRDACDLEKDFGTCHLYRKR